MAADNATATVAAKGKTYARDHFPYSIPGPGRIFNHFPAVSGNAGLLLAARHQS